MASILLTTAYHVLENQDFFSNADFFIDSSFDNLADNILYKKLLTNQSADEYSNIIPEVYGAAKISGNIIWSTQIKRPNNPEESYIYTFTGNAQGAIREERIYYVSLAVAICKGPIKDIERLWINGILVDQKGYKMRKYYGTEEQLPDPLIESKHGINKTPAYRGIAYVVFEDLMLAEFSMKLPNFEFEVSKNIKTKESNNIENRIDSIVILPGNGEFAYDTIAQTKSDGSVANNSWAQTGYQNTLNQHNASGVSNSILSLNQLKKTLPSVKWVAPVVNWFVQSLDINNTAVLPGVEFQNNALTHPNVWKVASFNRQNAFAIPRIEDKLLYGGTPNDISFIRYLTELKSRDYKVMLCPTILVATSEKPWRGRLSGTPSNINHFFNKKHGYKEFILHYAKLAQGKVDAFLIGSELVSLTAVQDNTNNFPAVKELVTLASEVRKILGPNVKISYAADWNEYHHTDGGWYHLDSLWAAKDIDFIGINAYFPLTEQPKSTYSAAAILDGWQSGEGHDFFYIDRKQNIKETLAPQYAWKNIEWWWTNKHIDPNGQTTHWIPKSKKIWFTEYGFPSIDCSSNQPHVSFDSKSMESNIPHHSRGYVDMMAQRVAIHGTLDKWENSLFVERKFLYSWDARPYPSWPSFRNIWDDADCWAKGHWVQGKLGKVMLSTLLADLCEKAGLKAHEYDVGQIHSYIEGFAITQQITAKKLMQILQSAYFFDIVENDGKICFIPRGSKKVISINDEEFVAHILSDTSNQSTFQIKRLQESEIPCEVNINFINKDKEYTYHKHTAKRYFIDNKKSISINLPLILYEYQALHIAKTTLYNTWLECLRYSFALPIKYAWILPSDVIAVKIQGGKHYIRVIRSEIAKNGTVKILGVLENTNLYRFEVSTIELEPQQILHNISSTLQILDIPLLPLENTYNVTPRILFAACGSEKKWPGCTLYYLNEEGLYLKKILDIKDSAIMGTAIEKLPEASPYLIDRSSEITINLLNGSLANTNLQKLLKKSNLALIGNEIIQFQNAKLIADHVYKISTLLRGRYGTENEILNHKAGDRFILLDQKILGITMPPFSINQLAKFKVFAAGRHIQSRDDFTLHQIHYKAKNMRPLAPCIISKKFSQNGIYLKWARRVRYNGEWKDLVDVPSLDSEQFLIELWHNDKMIKEFTSDREEYFIHNNDFLQIKQSSREYTIIIKQFSEQVGYGEPLRIPIAL